MSATASPFKIGVFVLAGLGLLLAGLVAFGLRKKLEHRVPLETYVEGSVDGLAVGSAVKLKGVQVGEVTDIAFSWNEYPGGEPGCVVIRFAVRTSAVPGASPAEAIRDAVRHGLRAMVESQGITGVAVLSLDVVDAPANPPVAVTWTPRTPVVPSAPGQIARIMRAAQQTLEALQRVDVARLSGELAQVLEAAQGMVVEIHGLARDARGTLRDARVASLSRDADRLLAGLEASNAKLGRVADRFSSVDVADLNGALAQAREVARHLDDTLAELRRYPSGFFFGREPPRVKMEGRR